VVWVPQTKICPSNWGKPEAILEELLAGNGRPSGSLPFLKIWKGSDKKWGRYRGPKMGFQISDNTCDISNGEDTRG